MLQLQDEVEDEVEVEVEDEYDGIGLPGATLAARDAS